MYHAVHYTGHIPRFQFTVGSVALCNVVLTRALRRVVVGVVRLVVIILYEPPFDEANALLTSLSQ